MESIVDSDEEDLESDIGSLAGLRDSVRECLEKDPSERTEDDVKVLLDLMGHLPVSLKRENQLYVCPSVCLSDNLSENAWRKTPVKEWKTMWKYCWISWDMYR